MSTQPFGVRFGYASTSSVKVMACSLSNADVTITVNGSDTVLNSMTELGTDSGDGGKPRAGYTDSDTISGLSAFTQYSWSATQGSNTITGTFYTAPEAGDDFCFYVGTCEANTYNTGNVDGMWQHMRTYANTSGALPIVGLLHIDDHGYWDFNAVDDGTYAVTGVPWTTQKVYDYALGAFAHFGVYDSGGNAYCTWGQDDDRIWGTRNVNLWPQWGDHDTGKNEMGWNINPAVAGLTAYTNSKAVWDRFMTPLQPPGTTDSGVTGANSWIFDCGCVTICAPDGISLATGDGTQYTVAPTSIYTNAQIDDILTDLGGSDNPFKILGLNYSIKAMHATPLGNDSLAQNPISLNAAEYARLFTASGNSPQSLMDNPRTNGKLGTLVTFHGDLHNASVIKHQGTGGALNEWFYSINVGTLNGSGNVAIKAGITAGTVYDGSTVELADAGGSSPSHYWAARVEVYGSRYPKEMHVYMLDRNNASIWSKKFVHQITGNESVSVDAAVFNKKVNISDQSND